MTADETKALLHRWYGEMWSQGRAELIPELAGPRYTRHEMGGTRIVSAEEYRDQTAAFLAKVTIDDLRYGMVAEGDKVCVIGSWRFTGPAEGDATPSARHWDWVQMFRAENGKLVETWLSGIGLESNWSDDTWQSLETHRC
ncbi:MAG: nuclear transport factor 2 family protein [Deltaproteobacteria bacterium]|jgi:predicted SnoaL-like aldol condensation-catalyzing enzyme|nr:nuclear transport factor 2 family protein [Deltaproteobacteria bacterium]